MRTDIYLMRLISGRSAPDENRDGKAEPSRCARFRVCVADTQLCKNAPLWHLISIALVLATGLATGCSDADGSDTDGSRVAPAVEGDRRVPFSPENDREFAEFFVEHHRAAIRMAQEAGRHLG
jgi:hypothetical protein